MIPSLKASSLSFKANGTTSARDKYNTMLEMNDKIAQMQTKIATGANSTNQIPMSGAQQGQNLDVTV